MLAKHSGTCPACGHYIAKGRSRITRLTKPQAPTYGWSDCGCAGSRPCSEKPHGRRYTVLGDRAYPSLSVSTHARLWAHERCAA
jgi:hypothetical protein